MTKKFTIAVTNSEKFLKKLRASHYAVHNHAIEPLKL